MGPPKYRNPRNALYSHDRTVQNSDIQRPAYLLRFAHGAHRLCVVSDMSSVPRTHTTDSRTTDEAVQTSRLVQMIGTLRVGRPSSRPDRTPSVWNRRQSVVGGVVVDGRVGATIAQVQFAVGTHPRRRRGTARVGRTGVAAAAQLAVERQSARLTVPLHDAVERAGRRQGRHVDGNHSRAGGARDDRLRGLLRRRGRTQTARRATGPGHEP